MFGFLAKLLSHNSNLKPVSSERLTNKQTTSLLICEKWLGFTVKVLVIVAIVVVVFLKR